MKTQLFIPTNIKVGFQERSDTYSKKLAYIIYVDNKGVLRKETSWEGWRDKKIEPQDFDNVPTSGFVLNKDAGGTRGHSWEQRQTYCRVYDPRGFEFEITIPNLLFILQECDSSKGKGLEGEFVYSWEGKDIVLLPVSADEYQQSVDFTKLQDEKIKAKDLIEGAIYLNNRMEKYIYLGRYQFSEKTQYDVKNKLSEKKQFIFYPVDDCNKGYYSPYKVLSSVTSMKKLVSETVVDNYSTLLQELVDSPHVSKYMCDVLDKIPAKVLEEIFNARWYGVEVYTALNNEKVRIICIDNKWYEQHQKLVNSHWYGDKGRYEFVTEGQIEVTEQQIKQDYMAKFAVYENNSKLLKR